MDKRPPLTRRYFRHPIEFVRWVFKLPSKRRVKVATSLQFLHEVLGLERLHYGLWEGEPLTLEGLKAAQRRYSEALRDWIPEGVETVLDVGCGVGTDARELAERGYRVEGLSPDPYQGEKFTEYTGLPFHLTRLQEFRPGRIYDLVLMSESAQYIWLESLFDKVRELAPGGHLLLADYFLRSPDGGKWRKTAHPLSAFDRQAEKAGFRLLRSEDLTDRVVPTLDLGRQWVDRYVEPSLGILRRTFSARHPWLYRAAEAVGRRPLARARRQEELLDSEAFRRDKCYLLRLYAVGEPGAAAGTPPGSEP